MKPTSLKIILDTPNIHIYGEQRPDASTRATSGRQHLVTGIVELQLRTATRIRSLDLSFFGEQIIRLPPTAVAYTNSKCLVDIAHEQPLIQISGTGNSDRYAAGTHQLPFRFMVPDDLPTSTELSFGHVRYAVRAQLVVSALRRTEYLAEETVVVVRCPGEGSEWAFSSFDALSTGTHWEDRISVTLSYDTCALGADTAVLLRVDVAAMEKQFSLLALDAMLQETQCAFGDNNNEDRAAAIRKETRIVAHKRMAFGKSGAELNDSSQFSVELRIPPALDRSAGIQYSCTSTVIRVMHRLTLTALIKSPDGPVVEVALPARVWVLPQAVVSRERESELPLYEHARDDRLVEAGHTQPSALVLPAYSLPVCLSCGKEDISVLECQVAIFHSSRMAENADIEDLCT
ncbi:hypothetical protein EV175_006098 [Coemansia sp. RSA 1933]|nr:hypothetical protein EV175_006098 [Coemansia sp. RSA 1933]